MTPITEWGKWHFEFFNEYDALHLQYPNLRQNTANFKLNYGSPYNLEVDVDPPYLSIYRTAGNRPSTGVGETNLGIKANFHKESVTEQVPALAASLYFEFPTGDVSQQLGSGLNDYSLNLIEQKSLAKKTRMIGAVPCEFCTTTPTRKSRAGSIEHGQFWLRIAHSENRMIPSRCSRNRSGQSTLEQLKTTAFNNETATRSIKSSYFHSISKSFNKSSRLVRDQGLYLA